MTQVTLKVPDTLELEGSGVRGHGKSPCRNVQASCGREVGATRVTYLIVNVYDGVVACTGHLERSDQRKFGELLCVNDGQTQVYWSFRFGWLCLSFNVFRDSCLEVDG